MGNLLRLLARDDAGNSCCSHQKYDVFLDFENAEASEEERLLYEDVAEVLRGSQSVISDLQQYKGAAKEIREAISDPGDDSQRKAWEMVTPLVQKLKHFYLFSNDIEMIVPRILAELCGPEMSPTQHLETQQALVKQFAEILEFTLKFDELKMTTPAIQNDFSYYRRTVMRSKIEHNGSGGSMGPSDSMEDSFTIDHQLANKMSLFYANSTPMLKILSEATSKFVTEHKEIPLENTTETLGTMAKVCQRMLENPDLIARFRREETQLFILRVMVALIILYDHVHPVGAFVKASTVDVKGCVKVLKDQPASSSENLLNALRYTTKHLNDDNTPKHIKSLLAL
ncbi:CYFIP-related Rac1 interactor B-like isoform X2 [Eriocheir sinensis]|uniref:CYFIP-related Rac1 interactor B-like isoform X2 n=1 Tax=Eriocheir sinensis TaxID=95602 RepID=UPI0021C59E00|nr:CYFIP-related Rac1 interactor B-like isoform X2 [Eriocheir sinensis]